MRLFNALITDENLEDPNGGAFFIMSSLAWACLLPRAETLKFTCLVDQIVGSPTLNVSIAGTTSAFNNYIEDTKELFTGVVSSASTIGFVYSPSDANYPPPRHLWVSSGVIGAGTKAHIRLWVCGRGPQLLEAIPPMQTGFAAQYAAARMMDDEDRLPGRRRALPQGASLFYPPELFEPSLKWDR